MSISLAKRRPAAATNPFAALRRRLAALIELWCAPSEKPSDRMSAMETREWADLPSWHPVDPES